MLGNFSIAITYDLFITLGLITAVPVSAGTWKHELFRIHYYWDDSVLEKIICKFRLISQVYIRESKNKK